MEDSLDKKLSKQVEHIFLSKQFDEVCPYFISIGMTYEQFWYDDVSIAKYYLKAFELKEEREALKNKWARWEQGFYVYEAISCNAPILRPFSKATKPLQYPKEPYGLEDINKNKANEEEKKKVELFKTQIFFENWAKAASSKFKEKGENSE